MPQSTFTLELPQPVAPVFAYLQKTANLVALAIPEFDLALAAGPDLLHLGARLTWKARRWGIAQTIQTEITSWEQDRFFVEEQRQGPLKSWRHERRFETTAAGMRLVETIDFEPPGGLVGMFVTADRIVQELEAGFAVRQRKLQELFPLLAG